MYLDGIVMKNGNFDAYVIIQDGCEFCGSYPTEAEARQAWVDAHSGLNHNRYQPNDAKVFVWKATSPDSPLTVLGHYVERDTRALNFLTLEEAKRSLEETKSLLKSQSHQEVTIPRMNPVRMKPKSKPKVPAMRFEFHKDRKKQWRWRLIAKNGNIIAESGEGYSQLWSCRRTVSNIIKNMPDVVIVEAQQERKKK